MRNKLMMSTTTLAISEKVVSPPMKPEIGTGWIFVMIVMIGFPHHQKINLEKIGRGILYFEIDRTIFMGKPIDNNTLDWNH